MSLGYISFDVKRKRVLRKLLNQDSYIGLYKRNYFIRHLKQQKNGTVIKIRISGLSFINLNFGKSYEERIIRKFSDNIKDIRKDIVVAKTSNRTFGIYINEVDIDNIKQLISEITSHMPCSVTIKNKTVKIHVKVACVIYSEDDFDLDEALNKLEISMSNLKNTSSSSYEIYNERYENYINIDYIENSLKSGEITMYYQPKIDVKTNDIKGVEALIRWNNKEHGNIAPDKLIEFSEKTGYINKLGSWIIKKSCEDIKYLNKKTGKYLDLSINISPYQLEDPGFIKNIERIVNEVDFDCKSLKFEITENKNIELLENIHILFKKIKDMGISLSIDDFGKGFNSIDYIKRYNVDEIKIDKSLVEYISKNPKFIENLISMIHTTNTSVVAEGVEREYEYKMLKNMGCDMIQGYYFHKPMKLDDLIEVIEFKRENNIKCC